MILCWVTQKTVSMLWAAHVPEPVHDREHDRVRSAVIFWSLDMLRWSCFSSGLPPRRRPVSTALRPVRLDASMVRRG